jgi:hypothetical protein
MIKRTLTTNEAAHVLLADEDANWTYDGAMAIAEFIEDMSEDMGEDIEFCNVAIRCEFSEYNSNDLVSEYGHLIGRELPSDNNWSSNCQEIMEEIMEAAEDYIVAKLDNGNFIVREC